MKFAIIPILPFLNSPNDLDPSLKTDLDLWDCFGRKIICLITKEICYMVLDGPAFFLVITLNYFSLFYVLLL